MRRDAKESFRAIGFHDYLRDTKVSALDKYQELVLGERNVPRLLRQEALLFLLSNMVGLPGLFLGRNFIERCPVTSVRKWR